MAKIGRFLQSEVGDLSILYMSQCSVMHAFPLPTSADIVRIPGLLQTEGGAIGRSLPLSFEEIFEVREQVMRAAAVAYRPDFFLVDHSPVGLRGDLLPTLRALKEQPNPPTIVCGLLDMISPEYHRRKWESLGAVQALEAFYDEIWVFGNREIFDIVEQYRLPDTVARKVRYCGYIGVEPPLRSPEDVRDELEVGDRKLVLVSVGGVGTDESDLLTSYLDALDLLDPEIAIQSVLVTGADFRRDVIDEIRARCERTTGPTRSFRILNFIPQFVEYMTAADALISRGGYNTVTETLSLGVRPIIVPTKRANDEQKIRARMFAQWGLVRLPDPARSLPEGLAAALVETFANPTPAEGALHESGLDFGGLSRVRDYYWRLMETRGRAAITGD
jgi:predicted glycosyltransferase